uniref:RING-type domain-containing protein n=1 Tax=Alexandrium monilatum TaxID=311494 RepID=A0A7S4VU36_9DINO|mmetsp:Transcript_103456/g.323698  ORF Transcript_103456/g.323698 Transcript_103456/m.323698 type:complete len:406 (+) Transcript_103456:3-1220(+)
MAVLPPREDGRPGQWADEMRYLDEYADVDITAWLFGEEEEVPRTSFGEALAESVLRATEEARGDSGASGEAAGGLGDLYEHTPLHELGLEEDPPEYLGDGPSLLTPEGTPQGYEPPSPTGADVWASDSAPEEAIPSPLALMTVESDDLAASQEVEAADAELVAELARAAALGDEETQPATPSTSATPTHLRGIPGPRLRGLFTLAADLSPAGSARVVGPEESAQAGRTDASASRGAKRRRRAERAAQAPARRDGEPGPSGVQKRRRTVLGAAEARRLLQHAQQSERRLQEAREQASVQEAAAEARTRELKRLRGEAEALQGFSAAELAQLAEELASTLARVQREHRQRCSQVEDERLCVICFSERKNVVVQPCNHCAMCESCFARCSSRCPQCRAPIKGHLKIFI